MSRHPRPAARAPRHQTSASSELSVFPIALALLLTLSTHVARAQTNVISGKDTARARTVLPAVVVTATRTPKSTFDVPAPVNYIDSSFFQERLPNSASDLFRDLPGLDVDGVGTNQVRPAVRGQRGQRILLLENGIRMNNSRRQQDFGELPSLVGPTDIQRVEVVRGPASVLYGTDAIGGVVNLITRAGPAVSDTSMHGSLSYLYGSDDQQHRPSGMLEQRLGAWSYRASAMHRETRPYSAPAGSFGNVILPRSERVNDTGVHDESYNVLVGWDPTRTHSFSAKYERYQARSAGYGYIDPALLGDDQPLIRILYPDQNVDRWLLAYRATGLGTPLADRVDVTAYRTENARHLAMEIFIPFGPGTPPGAGVQSASSNFTSLTTTGIRAEFTKALARQVVTYGADLFQDRSDNSDSSATTVLGFGPPRPQISTRPQVPNASFRSGGLFLQNDVRLVGPFSTILGLRVQDIAARTRATAGTSALPIESHDRTVVGAANLLYRVSSGVNLIASIARGFRSPNLVERFFDGPTPEGSGYQRSSPDLRPETSVATDLGIRARRGSTALEAFVFRNTLHDGIRIAPTGDSVNRIPAFQNVNVDRLRFSGAEVELSTVLLSTVELRGSYSRLASRNVLDPINPIGHSYSSKAVGEATYRHPTGRFWLSYLVRQNGRLSEEQIGSSPVGAVLPAFTVRTARSGLTLFERGGVRQTVTVSAENLGNVLYAESANASFFRPQPGRRLIMSSSLEF